MSNDPKEQELIVREFHGMIEDAPLTPREHLVATGTRRPCVECFPS